MNERDNKLLDLYKEDMVQETVVTTDKKLKVGIIGCGWIADGHLQEYLRMEDVEVVAVADLVPGKAEAFIAKDNLEGIRCYLNHKDMIDNEELDAVSICTYNTQHAGPAIYALEHGINVMLEKPFTVTLEEAVAVVQAEKKSGKILTVGFQPRMSENMKMIKRIVDSGELGDIYYLQAGGGRRQGIPTPFGTSFIEKETAGIGAVGDIGSYSIDMLMNAVGYPKPLTVSGYTSNFFGTDPEYYAKKNHPEYAEKFGVDDFAAAFVRLEGGIILDFRIAWAMNLDTPGDTIILGTKGGLRIPSTECWNGTVGGPMTLYHEVCGEQTQTTIPVIQTRWELFDLKIRTFLDAIKYNRPAPVSSLEILRNQAIIDGIAKSAELGREVEIDFPEFD